MAYIITVSNPGSGNKYYVDSVLQQQLTLQVGSTHRFDQSHSSNSSHPLRFSTTSDGTHGGGSEYTTGVTTSGTAGQAGAYTEITVASGAPTLYYYCTNHSGMGGQINTLVVTNYKDFVVKGPVIVGKDTKVTVGTITASAIDLATGNYFDDTLAANTTYTISNAGAVQAFQLEVTGGAVGHAISGTTYDSKSFSFASQDTAPKNVAFKSDGTKMYLQGQSTDDVFQYSLSTAWDISTASYDSVNLDLSSQSAGMSGITFKPDGTRLYTCDNVNDSVYQYSLTTAWDLSTASYDSVSFSVASQASVPSGVRFNSDGTSMFICDSGTDSIYQYTLSTAYDISTASYASKSFSFASQDTTPQGIDFNQSGTRLIMFGNTNKYVFQYSLSTPFDVSTLSYDSVFYDLTTQVTSAAYGLAFSYAGDKMYITTAVSDTTYQYSTSTTATVTWPTSIGWAGGVAPAAPANAETDVFTFTTDDTGTSYTGVKSIDNAS